MFKKNKNASRANAEDVDVDERRVLRFCLFLLVRDIIITIFWLKKKAKLLIDHIFCSPYCAIHASYVQRGLITVATITKVVQNNIALVGRHLIIIISTLTY